MTGEVVVSEDVIAGGEAVLRFLDARTSERVFGLPGSSSVPIFHGLAWSKAQFVPSLQEGGAVAMADGYARFAGPTGVLLYMLPGVATALSNIYNAWRDETPLVVVVSQLTSRARWGQGCVGEADLTEVVQPFCRFTREVTTGAQLVEALEAAHRHAVGPPSGPAVVVVPEDLLTGDVPVPASFPDRVRQPVVAADVEPLVEQLRTASRPLIVVGGQVRRTGGSVAVEQLADALDIPVMFEPFWNDRLGVAPGHRCALGQLGQGSSLATQADLVLGIGCRMFNEVHPRTDRWFPADAFVAHANADAQKVELGRGVSWSCAADPGGIAALLLDAIRDDPLDATVVQSRRARLDHARQRRSRPRPGPFAALAAALADELEHAYLVDESVSASQPLVAALRGEYGERYVSTTGGSLGWGIGAACGVALATEHPVTCVLGDGAFFFGVQGLWVAAARRLPVTFVVADNGGFGSTRWFEDQYAAGLDGDRGRPAYVGSVFGPQGPSVLDVARGFGLAALEVAAEDLRDELQLRRSAGHPAVLRVPIDEGSG